jgi:hypothetical protein
MKLEKIGWKGRGGRKDSPLQRKFNDKKTDPGRSVPNYFFFAGNLPFFLPASGWDSMISIVSA